MSASCCCSACGRFLIVLASCFSSFMRSAGVLMCSSCSVVLRIMSTDPTEFTDRVNSVGSVLMMRKTTEQELHIKTPADRIKELKQLAKTIKKRPQAEQQQLADILAKEYQQESEPILRRRILRTLSSCPVPAAGAVIVGAL